MAHRERNAGSKKPSTEHQWVINQASTKHQQVINQASTERQPVINQTSTEHQIDDFLDESGKDASWLTINGPRRVVWLTACRERIRRTCHSVWTGPSKALTGDLSYRADSLPAAHGMRFVRTQRCDREAGGARFVRTQRCDRQAGGMRSRHPSSVRNQGPAKTMTKRTNATMPNGGVRV